VRDYEVVFIVKPLEEEQTEAVIGKFENLITTSGGTVNKLDRWGKRRLAYEIKDLWEGFYCLILFSGEAAVVSELDRVLKITDDILRHMIIRVGA
jgi:small subunit ribosomal protein S6